MVYLRPGSSVKTQHLVDSKRAVAFVADGKSWAQSVGLSATAALLHLILRTFALFEGHDCSLSLSPCVCADGN